MNTTSLQSLTIGIIGLGLIGGSLGLDLQSSSTQTLPDSQLFLIKKILGVSRSQTTCERAVERGVVDQASVNLSLMAEADLIFICTPIGLIIPTIQQLIPYLKPTTVLTDVGSVKQPIVEQASQLWPNFVGGHPMAGTEQVGIDAAQPHLFVNRPYVITAMEQTPELAIQMLSEIVQRLGAKPYYCQPQDHDQAVAWISHAPVMVSASLLACLKQESTETILPLAEELASSGFRDTSRVGGGNPELGVMMAEYNQAPMLRSLYAYRQTLDQLIETIEQQDWQTLTDQLTQTQQMRKRFHF